MRKRKCIKELLWLSCLFLFLYGCVPEEDYIINKTEQNKIKMRYLYGKEAQRKGKTLESKIGNSYKINVLSRTDIALSTNEGIVDYTKVLEVIDENNNVNYTFNILNHPEDSETVFHNLVLSNENTSDEEILLLKYETETANTSIVNFNGTITTKSISSATNPCDTSISDVDFTGYNTVGDNGSAIPIPGDNNTIVTPPYSGGSGGGNSDNSLSDGFALYDCNSAGCTFRTTDRAAMLDHYAPQGYTVAYYFGRISNTSTTTNPCDPNGNIGIINDSIVKTPCSELNKISRAINVKSSLELLKTKTQGMKEFGFAVKKSSTNNANFNNPEVIHQNIKNPNQLNITAFMTGEYVGIMHNHPNPLVGPAMFSGTDVTDGLFDLANNAENFNSNLPTPTPTNFQEFFMTLAGYDVHTGTSNTFVIKIKNWNTLLSFMQNGGRKKLKEKLESVYKKLYIEAYENDINNPIPTMNNLKKGFLSVLKELNVGVGLFQATSGLNSWSEVTYNPANDLLTNLPCN